MCFSATASYTSGVVILGVGAFTLPLVRNPRERPFAALPVLFGMHQILEGVVWRQVEQSGLDQVRTPAMEVWLLFAWLVLPFFVPLAVWWMEPEPRRRRAILGLAGVGALIGTYLAVQSMILPVTVAADGHHLVYLIPFHPGWLLGVPYVAATCGAPLLSSHRFVVIFGAVLTTSMAVTVLVDAKAFSSVWCFFAAMMSVGLYVHYARADARPAELPA